MRRSVCANVIDITDIHFQLARGCGYGLDYVSRGWLLDPDFVKIGVECLLLSLEIIYRITLHALAN